MGKFGEKLKALRKEQDLTQDDLAEKLGISRSAVGMYEQGRREPDFEILDNAAELFNVSIGYLVGNETKGSYPVHIEKTKVSPENTKKRIAEYSKRVARTIEVTAEEARILQAFRDADKETKKAVKAMLRVK
ncbi:MAG: helix-turn-helix transcriptional regulator [Lachnospiraceae bacterium]|nr:helix-turn-helix transcriptional regulator [Lachnospiraceae bacterium]